MLAKKSAFDILMNKNKLKEKTALTSDSDSDIIIIKNVKNTTNNRKSPEKENNLNSPNQTNVNSNRQKTEPLDIQSLFVCLDTAFTIAPHTSQLSQIDLEFLHSFNHSKLSFKPECTFDVNSIELNRAILKLPEHQEKRNTKKKRQTKNKKADEELVEEEKLDTNRTAREDNYELWTEKYMFTSENDIVTNTGQFERLKEWLKNWKSILSNEDAKNAKDKNYDSGSEYSYDSDASNTDSAFSGYKRKFYSNAILLSGPHGCGKTSSVHVVAKQLGFKIFEVNSSSLRCKTQIIQELEGAMNSHHVSSSNPTNSSSSKSNEIASIFGNKLNSAKLANNDAANFKLEKFFKSQQQSEKLKPTEPKTRNKKRKISLRKETVLSIHNKTKRRSKKYKKDENESEPDDIDEDEASELVVNTNASEESSVNIHKESLILFDEVDVVFREDVGFLAAINYFIKKSKKPIILTTNDDFLQEKINLNIERIVFVRPRVDAAIKYLKKVSKQENFKLDTPTAYKIIGDCKCDMRRALLQLQTLFNSSHTGDVSLVQLSPDDTSTDLNSYIPNGLTSQQQNYFDNFYYLDKLTRELKANELNSNHESNFKKYDLVLLKDGLSDNSVCTNVSVFNPFLPVNSINNNTSQDFSNDATSHHLLAHDLYTEYMRLFNKTNCLMDFNEWSKHGLADHFNYSSNAAVNKFAQATFKSTTSEAVSLEYRPFLQIICQTEEKNQAKNSTKRRYLHYLHYSNMGLAKEDFQILAKSNLTCVDSARTTANNDNNETCSNQAKNDDIFSSENI